MYRNQFESITLMMSAHKMTSDWKEVDGCKCACLPQIPICHSLKKKKEEKKNEHIFTLTQSECGVELPLTVPKSFKWLLPFR